MTSLTTVVGFIPMAVSTGEGSEMWGPMGKSALGGMLLSTLITLIIVPVLYHLFEFARRKKVVREPVGPTGTAQLPTV